MRPVTDFSPLVGALIMICTALLCHVCTSAADLINDATALLQGYELDPYSWQPEHNLKHLKVWQMWPKMDTLPHSRGPGAWH